MNSRYGDMLHLPHHVSEKRARMSDHDRAAQFSPFAALTGHDDAIRETARLTEQAGELYEDEMQLLDFRIRYLLQHPACRAAFTFFCPDDRKDGGHYETVTGGILKADPSGRVLTLSSGISVPIPRIKSIQIIVPSQEEPI